MHLRTKIGAIGAAATLTVALAGCGDEAAADPALQLTSSAEALTEEPFKIEMTFGDLMSATGAIDPGSGLSEVTMGFDDAAMGMEMRVITSETDMWMSMGGAGELLGVEEGWMHLDLSRLGPEGFMGVEPGGGDPANAIEMLQAVAEVEQTDDNSFEGVIDLTEAQPAGLDEEAIAMLGEDAMTVAFTATIDDEGRLSEMSFDMPDMGVQLPQSMNIRYYDYGVPVEVTAPSADEVNPMPDMLYEMFDQG